jgi:hypothetical protein
MTTFGVLGRGDSTESSVITACLHDAIDTETDDIHLPWYGKPIPTDLEVVYDWVLDNEVTFTLYAEDTADVPKAFHKCPFGTVVAGDPVIGVATACSTLLYLWDADYAVLDFVASAAFAPSLVLDLTNGLHPVEFEGYEEAITDTPDSKYDDDDDDDDDKAPQEMTRDELEIMPALSVKRYASAKLGEQFTTKSAAIEALFPSVDAVEEEDPTDDDTPPPAPVVRESSLSDLFAELENRLKKETPSDYRDQSLFRLYEAKTWYDRTEEK